MDSLVLAFANDTNRSRIAELLEAGGYVPRKLCKTGTEAIRMIRSMGGGVIVCGYKLADMTADDLAYDLNGLGMVLVVAKPPMLAMCESEGIYKIPTPIRKNDLLASVALLLELEERRPIRYKSSCEDKSLINNAKLILMERCAMSEAEAHRFIQKKSMDLGIKMASMAGIIIAAYT
ncbi:hypothetical protein IMSAG049_00070 [Clostridiales bacterium]|nr:hypothetical protein IMSAG049_00070 [Clostridiales bacterium]